MPPDIIPDSMSGEPSAAAPRAGVAGAAVAAAPRAGAVAARGVLGPLPLLPAKLLPPRESACACLAACSASARAAKTEASSGVELDSPSSSRSLCTVSLFLWRKLATE